MPDETMIERVARAMHQVEGIMMPWDAMPDDFQVKRLHRLRARAAIEAMREPTSEMLDSGASVHDQISTGSALLVWQDMIDAALTPSSASSLSL